MTTNTSPRRAAQHRLADFVSASSGAVVDRLHAPSIDFSGNIVVCGEPAEMQKVAAWARSLGATCEVDGVDPDDEDFANWTCARIPMRSVEEALTAWMGL